MSLQSQSCVRSKPISYNVIFPFSEELPSRCQIHGDAAPFKKTGIGSSILGTLWKSIVGFGGSTWDHHYMWDGYVDGIETSQFRKKRWELMAWDWWHALHGTFPVAQSDKSPLDPADEVRYNRAGHPIAGGYRLAISGLLADVKHMVEEICVG